MKNKIPYEEIENGAQILLLLRENNTWEKLCNQYEYVYPDDLISTTTMTLRNKLLSMRELGLINFKDEETPFGKKPVGEINETGLWVKDSRGVRWYEFVRSGENIPALTGNGYRSFFWSTQ